MSTARLFEKYYYGDQSFVDGTTQFHELCAEHIARGSHILEIGAGPTNETSDYLASIGPVHGADVSEEVLKNSALTSARVFAGKAMPFATSSLDACVSNFVIEHVPDPGIHFREVARVLKPKGVYVFRTPNIWHYVAMAANMLPHSVHLLIANRLRGLGPEAHDPYPTVYRANTRPRLTMLCHDAGMEVRKMVMIEKEPSYGRAHELVFFPMMLYERAVNSTSALEFCRANILGVFQKRASHVPR
jgi:SAM-dependent methyltransferase